MRVLSQNLRADQADILVNSGATVEQTRAAAQWAVTQRQAPPTQRVTAMLQIDAPEAINTRMGEAMFARATGAKPGDAARPYMGLTVLDMARDCLTRAGASFTGLSGADVITRSLHATADFPSIFGDTLNRVLRTGYDAAPAALKAAAKQTTAKDFRTKTVANFGEARTLEKVNEAGEFKSGTMADAKESYKIDTFGKIIGWSRQAMINDDLGALTDMGGKWGRAAADFEAQFLVTLLEQNSGNGPVMGDTVETKAGFEVDGMQFKVRLDFGAAFLDWRS